MGLLVPFLFKWSKNLCLLPRRILERIDGVIIQTFLKLTNLIRSIRHILSVINSSDRIIIADVGRTNDTAIQVAGNLNICNSV